MNRNVGKGVFSFLMTVLVVGLALVAGPVPMVQATPGGPTCTVGSGADYTTIADALAVPGCTTINVAAGTYDVTSTIVVNRAVIISGPAGGGAIVQGTNSAAVSIFEIAASGVTIQNLKITHNALTPGLPVIPPATQWEELPNSLIRIPAGSALSAIAITGNTIYVPLQSGAMSAWNGVGITVGSGPVSGISITGNTIYNTRDGVVVHYNNTATISNNTIYNTKGGIMNYTGSQADADNRTMAGNTWGTVHNEWDIVWNSGGGPYEPDYNQSVLVLSGANNGAYVISKMTTNPNPTLVTGNRSHIFVNAATGTSTKNWGSGNMNQPYATITLGTEAVVPGGTVYVAAGTYTENVPLNKRLSLLGAGSGTSGTIITNPSGGDSKIGVVQITASGVSAADPLLLKDLRIQPVGLAGLSIGRFTEATGLNVSYLELDNVHVIGTNASPATEQERGFYVDLTSTVQNLVIKNSAFDNLSYGWYLMKHVSADASTVRYVNVSGTTFNHNNLKGIYAEKLADAAFTGCTVDGNGFSSVGVPTYFAPNMAGIDINLKAGAYQNISIANSTITNNGLGGAKEGVGLMVKARNDGGTYGPFPATLSNVQITSVTVTGNERGIRFGEPDKSNAGPTNAIVTNSTISGNVKTYAGTDGTAYGGLVNMTTAFVKAEKNWWGDTDPSNDIAGPGTIDYSPWLGAGPGSSPMTWYTNDSIQDAINAASAGDTVNVVAGTYVGAVNIPASLTLKGAQYGVSVSGRTAASESTIQGLVTVDASNVEVDGFTLTNPGQTSALYIKNHTPSHSVIAVTHNIVDNVGAPGLVSTSTVHAILINLGPDSVTIAHNRFNNIKSGGTKSANAIGVLDSTSADASTGLVIQDNTFSDIASASKGAYGVILNNKTGVPGAQIKDNTFSGLNGGWTHAIGLEGPTPNAVVSGNVFSGLTAAGADNAAIFFEKNSVGNTVTIEHNQFNGAGFYGVAIHPNDLPSGSNGYNYTVNADINYWGATSGPGPVGMGTGAKVGTNVTYSPWCLNGACTAVGTQNASGELVVDSATTAQGVQDLLNSVSLGTVIVLPPGVIPVSGGFTITTPGITIKLSNGTVIQASSPCFTVSADNVTIKSDTFLGGVCEPSGSDHGIQTGAAVNNLVIQNIEIRKGSSATGDGIHVGHNVTNLQILDNYIHGLDGDGIEYATGVTVSGVHEVQGNLFQNNAGSGVNNASATSYVVKYNSWGDIGGPNVGSGDGAVGSLDYTPWTHVGLSMVSSVSPVLNKVAVGAQIKYTIKMAASEVWGADFDLAFDNTKLSVVSITNSGTFQQQNDCKLSTPTQANTDGAISFCGSSTAVVNGAAQNVFEVVFQGGAAGVVPLNLDENTDKFAMAPPGGGSNNIYAGALTDGSVTVFATYNVTGRLDLQGRANDTGAALAFAVGQFQGYGGYAFSTSDYWGAISKSGVVEDTYAITISMARYLDVTVTSSKSVAISADKVLSTLVLLGGDANDDNLIDVSDAGIIGGQYGNSGVLITLPGADINADSVVDLLDLVIMGGNYDKQSSVALDNAYAAWTP